MQIKLEDCDLSLHAIYRSPNSSVENNSKINDFIRSLTVNSIVVGDFNHPSVNWELQTSNQQHSREFMEAVNDAFLTQHVDFPTHDGGNLLDLVLSNIPNRVRQVIEKGKLGNSDHVIICTEIDACWLTKPPKHTVWNFALAKFEEMGKEMAQIDWKDILSKDVETDWQTFKGI